MRRVLMVFICLMYFSSCHENSPNESVNQDATSSDKKLKPSVKNGLVRSKDPSTGIVTELNLKEGKREGPSFIYYSNGQLWQESHYKDDVLHGPVKKFDQNGLLKYEASYEYGKKQGPQVTYFKSGNPSFYVEYHQDRPLLGFYEKDYMGKIKAQPELKYVAEEVFVGPDKGVNLFFSLSPTPEGRVIYYFVDEGRNWEEIVRLNETDFYLSRLPLRDRDQNSAFMTFLVPRGQFNEVRGEVVAVYQHSDKTQVAVAKRINLSFENF